MTLIPFEFDPKTSIVPQQVTPQVQAEVGQEKPAPQEKLPAAWSVTELTRTIASLLENKIGEVWVEGELSNVKSSANGHCYFSLKDDKSQIRCVMFAYAKRLQFDLEDGLQVTVRGKISVYGQRGEYQIQAQHIEPKGVGAFQIAFEQLKSKLGSEGLFEPARKKKLPTFPFRIGMVTSVKGAALHDMLRVLKKRYPVASVLLYPATVQGEHAAPAITEGVQFLDAHAQELGLDVIVIGRGGGSLEDLWAFNDETLAYAIAAADTPIVSAVGHEVDFTISDFVSDVRAPTPSAAIEQIVPELSAVHYTIEQFESRLKHVIQSQQDLRQERFERIKRWLRTPEQTIQNQLQQIDDLTKSASLCLKKELEKKKLKHDSLRRRLASNIPRRDFKHQQEHLANLQARLHRSLEVFVKNSKSKFGEYTTRLESASPLSALQRGYAVPLDSRGKTVRSIAQVKPDDELTLHLQNGLIHTKVCSTSDKS